MNDNIRSIILAKIDDAISEEGLREIYVILDALGLVSKEFGLGIIIGRVYNSFHYQSRRVLGRDATDDEFKEFVSLLNTNLDRIRDSLSKIL